MPKNPVADPITDQELAFAHLILSGTMNDRQAAEAAGLNPDTAAYTKSKPRVRDYMVEHRAAVREKLVDQESEGLRRLNLGRDQILARLWELANLSPEVTRGSIAGQVKALSMIVAIEQLIPSGLMNDRRLAPPTTQPAAPPVQPPIYASEFRPARQHQANAAEPAEAATPVEAQPGPAPQPETPCKPANDAPRPGFVLNKQSIALNPFVHHPEKQTWVPAATGFAFDAVLDAVGPLRLPISLRTGRAAHRR